MVLAGLFGSILCGLWLDKTKAFKFLIIHMEIGRFCIFLIFRQTVFVVYALSFLGMALYTFLIGLQRLWIVFVISGFLGCFSVL